MASIFNAERTLYQLPDGLAELVDDARAILGEAFAECDSTEAGEVLAEALQGKNEISLADFMTLFERLRRTRRIRSNDEIAAEETQEPEAEPLDDRHRDSNGRPMSEYESFYSTKTAREIRERIKEEPAFARFARSRMAGEFHQSGDGSQPAPTTTAHPALAKFAHQYVETPSAQLRPIMGYVTVQDGTRFTLEKFNALVAEAAAAKLI